LPSATVIEEISEKCMDKEELNNIMYEMSTVVEG